MTGQKTGSLLSPRSWGWTEPAVHVDRIRRSCPHARGDGPPTQIAYEAAARLSPRSRGWTVNVCANSSKLIRCPHARGDGPPSGRLTTSRQSLSPRSWGWTAQQRILEWINDVVPARGDGPIADNHKKNKGSLSPRSWGWTGDALGHHVLVPVVPTLVGMDRWKPGPREGPRKRCPHARGDGPVSGLYSEFSLPLSPRSWGWTVGGFGSIRFVKMSPRSWGWTGRALFEEKRDSRCPHARGNGPKQYHNLESVTRLSPRSWGWTANKSSWGTVQAVCPTLVGMDRESTNFR